MTLAAHQLLHHTGASDWLGDDLPAVNLDSAARAMRLEAGKWVRRAHPDVLADEREFLIQAQGLARRLASQYGSHAPAARKAFLAEAQRLRTGGQAVVANDLLSRVQQIIASPELTEEAEHLVASANSDGTVTVTWQGGKAGFGMLSMQMGLEDAGLSYVPASARDSGDGSAIRVTGVLAGNEQSGYAETALPTADEDEEFYGIAYPEGWVHEHPEDAEERSSEQAKTSRQVRAESFPWDKDKDNDSGDDDEDDEVKADKAGDSEEDKADAKDAKPWEKGAKARPLRQIAAEIAADWPCPAPAAKPYLDAMAYLDKVSEPFGAVTARDVVSYFVANSDGWTGKTATRLKAELCYLMGREHARVMGSRRVAATFTGDDGASYGFSSRYAIWTNQGGVVWEGDDLQDGLAWVQSSLTNQGDPMAFEAQVWEAQGGQAVKISSSTLAMLSALRILDIKDGPKYARPNMRRTSGDRKMSAIPTSNYLRDKADEAEAQGFPNAAQKLRDAAKELDANDGQWAPPTFS